MISFVKSDTAGCGVERSQRACHSVLGADGCAQLRLVSICNVLAQLVLQHAPLSEVGHVATVLSGLLIV